MFPSIHETTIPTWGGSIVPIKSLVFPCALVAAFAASSAAAVSLNPRGVGQALIYPYYTVNKGQDTLVSLVNTSSVGKAAMVYVREGYNGRFASQFVVYLPPNDVWTGAISQVSEGGGAKIATQDKTCVVPASSVASTPFSSSDYDGSSASPADGGPVGLARTREGYIEVLAIGDIIPGSPTEALMAPTIDGQSDNGAPFGCNRLDALPADISPPTSGLVGSAVIVNVSQGTFFGYNATALIHVMDIPGVAAGDPFNWDSDAFSRSPWELAHTSESATKTGAVAYLTTDRGKPLALDYDHGVDAVSAVLAADSIYNEYLVGGDIGASTDWVVTFPTKADYVDSAIYLSGGDLAIPPFNETFGHAKAGASEVLAFPERYDHEGENAISGGGTNVAYVLPHQVNVISFSSDPDATISGVLGSPLPTDDSGKPVTLQPYGTGGWTSLAFSGFNQTLRADRNGVVLPGMPLVGFMVYNVVNAAAQPGKLANYGGAFPHHSSTTCHASGDSPSPNPCD